MKITPEDISGISAPVSKLYLDNAIHQGLLSQPPSATVKQSPDGTSIEQKQPDGKVLFVMNLPTKLKEE